MADKDKAPAAGETPAAAKAKMGKVGCLEVRVVEARDIPCTYVTVSCELGEYSTTPKKKNEANPQFDQTFFIPVNRPISVLTVMTFKKKLIGGDKPNGYFAISLNATPRPPNPKKEPEWYTLVAPQKRIVKGDFIAGGLAEGAEGDAAAAAPAAAPATADGAAGGSSEPEKSPRPVGEEVGRIRLQLYLHTVEPEKPALKGITLDGEWKEGLNGGSIVANPFWYENPQYLLTVSSMRDVTITLQQPNDRAEAATFYVLRYDDTFYKGRRKTVFHVDDAVKLEGDFLCPVAGARAENTYKLAEGMYCVIPCSNIKGNDATLPRYNGKFQIAAFSDRQECISLMALPTDVSLGWHEQRTAGVWTAETSGGADVTGTQWSKNPQFLLTLAAKSNVSVVLSQRVAKLSIGLYVIRVQDTRHKAVCYTEEVGATAKCCFACSVGVTMPSLEAGSYVIIPVTFDAQQAGDFDVTAYTMDPAARLSPLVAEWPHKRTIKGRWAGVSAGGSPNHKTFVNNPQFALTLSPKTPEERAFSIQLTQSRSKRSPADLGSIGIVVLKNVEGEKAEPGDLQKENVVVQTEGWSPLRAIGVTGMLPENPTKLHAVVIPSTIDPGQEYKFSLTVLSEAKLSLEQIGEEDDDA